MRLGDFISQRWHIIVIASEFPKTRLKTRSIAVYKHVPAVYRFHKTSLVHEQNNKKKHDEQGRVVK